MKWSRMESIVRSHFEKNPPATELDEKRMLCQLHPFDLFAGVQAIDPDGMDKVLGWHHGAIKRKPSAKLLQAFNDAEGIKTSPKDTIRACEGFSFEVLRPASHA